MGSGRLAGNGERSPEVAGDNLGDRAVRIFMRVSAGRDRGENSTAAVGMAGDVLGWRIAGAARLLHSLSSERNGVLEAAPRAGVPVDRAHGGGELEAVPV